MRRPHQSVLVSTSSFANHSSSVSRTTPSYNAQAVVHVAAYFEISLNACLASFTAPVTACFTSTTAPLDMSRAHVVLALLLERLVASQAAQALLDPALD